MAIRPAISNDRAALLAKLGGDPRTIDSPNKHIHVAEEEGGQIVGAVVWLQPDAGEEALLGLVTAPPNRWDIFYGLLRGAIEDAVGRGLTKGTATVSNVALLAKLEHDFAITVEASGWDPQSHQPVQWDIAVDLADVLNQLNEVLL